MEWIYNPTPEQAADDAAKAEAERIERTRTLSFSEFKERMACLPLAKHSADILRLDLQTVPEDVRGIYQAMRERKERGC